MPAKPIVIGVIPSRYASHRLPAKPLIDLCGKPMVQRVYEQAKKAQLLDRVVVATDDVRIEEAVRQFGGDVMLTSQEIASGSDRVAAVALHMTGDIFVNIQSDEPLIAPEMIDQGVQLLLNDTSVSVGTLVKQISSQEELFNPNVVKVVLSYGEYAIYFSRSTVPYVRGEADEKRWLERYTFYKHIGLYIFRRKFLVQYAQLPVSNLEKVEKLEQLRILEAGYKIKAGITKYDSIPIDTPGDVARVVAILQQTSSDI
ncbi:MAG: 3-deoxy-manno-octulosonate cytidylyltransferase [Bacteroidota bacterium]